LQCPRIGDTKRVPHPLLVTCAQKFHMLALSRVRISVVPRAGLLLRQGSCGTTTNVTEDDIVSKLKENLKVEEIYVNDTSGGWTVDHC
jgi:hypothetical protein